MVKGFTHAPYTLNPYTYCWNQPIDFVDLDGLEPVSIADGGGGSISPPSLPTPCPTMGIPFPVPIADGDGSRTTSSNQADDSTRFNCEGEGDADSSLGLLSAIWNGIHQSFVDFIPSFNNFWDGVFSIFNWAEMLGIGGRTAILQLRIDSLPLELIPFGTPLNNPNPRHFPGDIYRRYLNNNIDKDIRINKSKLKTLKKATKGVPVIAGVLNFINRIHNGDNVVEAAGMATVTTVGAVQGAKYGAKSGAWLGTKIGVFGGPKGVAIGGVVGGFIGGVAGAITGSGVVEGVVNFFRRG